MSHVIPLCLFQTLKLHRWNCNVCGLCPKMTVLNYVRLLGGPGKGPPPRDPARGARDPALSRPRGSSTMSHVIPLCLFQTLKLHCWNCNVCGLCPKMTVLNYVRLLGDPGKGPPPRDPARGARDPALSRPRGSSTMSHVIPLCLFQTLKLYRWNCNVCGLCPKMTVLNYVRL